MSKRKHLILILALLISGYGYSQPKQPLDDGSIEEPIKNQQEKPSQRLIAGIGLSCGYSAHADSYFEDIFVVREYPGFRIIVLDARLGWAFHKRFAIYGTWRFSPANTTISPYRSLYQGANLSYYLSDSPNVSIHGGAGKYQSKISKDETAGDGLLVNVGLAFEFNDHALCELNVLTGDMNPGSVRPNPFASREFYFTVGVAFLF